MNVNKNNRVISIREKMNVIKELQLIHQKMSGELKDNLMSPNQYKRSEFTKFSKTPISMVDLQDVPDNMNDKEILYLIGSLLSPDQMDQIILGRSTTHKHLLFNKETKDFEASSSLMKAFQAKLKNAMDELLNKGFHEKHFNKFKEFFETDSDNNIKFESFSDVTAFIRKSKIKELETLTERSKVKNIYIACSLLKEMLGNQDFKNNKEEVRRIQDATDHFFKGYIQPLFPEWVSITENPIIDPTHKRFLDDKYLKFGHDLLEKHNINSEELLLKMSYRAKEDKSIKDKNIINPTTTTLNSIHDLGGIKTLLHGEHLTDENLLVGYYGIFKIIIEASEKSHPDLYKIAPSNHDAFKKGGLYEKHPEIIEPYLNAISTNGNMFDKTSPLVKDKGFLPIKKHKNGGHYIDEDLLEKSGIDDIRFLYLLESLCKQKDIEYKQKNEMRGRKESEMKEKVFSNIIDTILENENIQDTGSEMKDGIWHVIKNYENIVKKNQIKDGEKKNIGKDMFLMKEGNILYVTNTDNTIKIYLRDIEKYKNLFVSQWEEEKKEMKNKSDSHKGIRPDAKISFKVFIDGKFVNIEWQIGKEEDIKNIPLMDEHSIYGPAKQLLVYGRNSSGILNIQDIDDIIDNKIIKIREKDLDHKLENGLTYREMMKNIEQDNKLLPSSGTFRDKLMYNFTHERGLEKKGNLYYTQYYRNLQSHGLAA